MSKEERTGWRDKELSLRHRQWGFNCPAVDLDFLMLEYNHGKPAALVEYKHKNAKKPNISHPTYQSLICLANEHRSGSLPCFIAIYDPEVWSFSVTPLNEPAKQHYNHCLGKTLSEQQFVKSLYLLRKKVLSEEDKKVIAKLNYVVAPRDFKIHWDETGHLVMT